MVDFPIETSIFLQFPCLISRGNTSPEDAQKKPPPAEKAKVQYLPQFGGCAVVVININYGHEALEVGI